MNTWRRRWLALLVLALVSGLVYIFVKTQAYDATRYLEELALLRQVRQFDASLEVEVLKVKAGVTHGYDALFELLPDRELMPGRLHALLVDERRQGNVEMANLIDTFAGSLTQKAKLIESFKFHHATLEHALATLPLAAKDLREHLETATPGLHQRIDKVLLMVLIFDDMEESDPELVNIAVELADLSARVKAQGQLAHDALAEFSRLTEAVLHEHRHVADLIAQIAMIPTGASLDDIQSLLTAEEKQAELAMRRYRQILLALSAALVTLLLYAALRLVRSHATIRRINLALQQSNDGLEQRVQARTVELALSNARLSAQISERKALQSRMVQTEKLASLGLLSAGVAHEINNPLGFLSSNLGMLEEYFGELLHMLPGRDDKELDFLRRDIPLLIQQSKDGMDRVSTIVQSLNSFSRVDRQQDWQSVDLHNGIDSTLVILASQLRKVARIDKRYGDLPTVSCLPSEINQVFMNLLVNASQACTPGRGLITIRSGTSGDEVWIDIEDNGSGIEPESLAHIFDPFFTTKPIGQGTGLGLSISYGIVERHKGRIEAHSTPGYGSRFRVWLPCGADASRCHQRQATAALST